MKYVFIAILLLAYVAAAHTVTMNLALNVGGTSSNTLRVNDTSFAAENISTDTILIARLDNSTLDSSQYGNNGTINGGTNCSAGVAGKINSACSFDGADDYINVSTICNTNFNTYGQGTISLWFKASAISYAGDTDSWNDILFSSRYDEFTLAFEVHNHLRWELYNNAYYGVESTTANFTTGVWYNVASTYGSNGMQIFVNGVLENNNSYTGAPRSYCTSIDKFIIGNADPTWGTRGFNGTIDEVAIYNRTLTADEIYKHYIYGLQNLTFTELSKNYIAVSENSTTAALVSAGTLFNTRLNVFNSTHHGLQMTQAGDDNRFLFAVTNGSYTDVENRLSMVDAFRMVSSTFGNFITTAPTVFPLFIRLEYTNIDIDNRADWSGVGQLRIRNNGVTSRNLPNLTLEVVR